jgi:hypothetical protein
MIINNQNFLRFDDGTGPDPKALPLAYIRDRCRPPFMPILVPGETLSFYVNTRYGYDYGDGLRLQFVDIRGNVTEPAGVIQYDDIDITHYNIYASFAIPVLSDGRYTIRILRSNGSQVLESNPLYCMNSGYENISSYVEFTNTKNWYNVRYSVLTNFYQKFRLRITDATGGDYEQNNESYRSVTTGEYRDLLSIPEKAITFEAYYFDDKAFEALSCFLSHRTRIVNQKIYAFKEGLTHDPITTVNGTKGTFKMYDQEFSAINVCS